MHDSKSAEEVADEAGRIAVKIREELARRHMSRQQLAEAARLSLSTLEKTLNGSRPFTLSTLVRLEAALGIALRPDKTEHAAPRGSASPELGAYTYDAVKWLIGDYLTLRPSFSIPDGIYAYRTAIAWDAEADCLAFRETDREDAWFAQKGMVSVPNKSGHIYLHTNTDGQFRLAILGRPLIGGEMYGILATLQAGQGTQLVPVSVPYALVPMAEGNPVLGRITPDADVHARYKAHLSRIVAEGFARLLDV
ncbi:MAG TPA: helix-turn-helix transcriptional regulator [Asticcacaulis sp.]|nr:helix-turn-helix transcriptional regulator [Asticcacaulis sp.]